MKYIFIILASAIFFSIFVIGNAGIVVAQSLSSLESRPVLLAQNQVQTGLNTIKGSFPGNKFDSSDPDKVLHKVIDMALYIAFVVSVIFVIISGYKYVFAGGNTEEATKAKSTLTNALIGLVVVVLSFMIVQVVFNFITS